MAVDHCVATGPVTIVVEHAGHEVDLFGTNLRSFTDITSFALRDYRIHYEHGLASRSGELLLAGECVRYESESNTAAMNQPLA